ncbi:MAG TPA: peptide chain release factor N(5)-glutamine methyltransferase [Sphingobium sp.]|uniref:peptide chain release factor N(5)-glutamine methyltransferase n=1 Tax=Sphingobium sp. TaxID=1912891 RepID=UPI002ED57B23
MSLAQWLREAAVQLEGVSDTPRLDAELLAAHALGMERQDMLLRLRDLDVPEGAGALIARRLRHEPIAHITGRRDFWTLTLAVTPDVLIPRPDSETLIEAAVAHFAGTDGPARVLDLGTGSGALLLAALDQWPHATGLGIDISPRALSVAHLNAEKLGMGGRVRFRQGDWAQGVDELFDLILCNPPYIPSNETLSKDVSDYEPYGALFAGSDGLDCYRQLAPTTARLIAPGGTALFEIGHDQGETVPALFKEAGFAPIILSDLGGRARCVKLVGRADMELHGG